MVSPPDEVKEIKDFFRKIVEGSGTEKDIEGFIKLLGQVFEHDIKVTFQFGKQVVNIGEIEEGKEGKGIQIGDHVIHQGGNLEVMKNALPVMLLEELQNRQLSTQSAIPDGLGKLSNVPNFPPHFLNRSDQLMAVKALLLAEAQAEETQRVVIHGMGGTGKSVLAVALARDDEVRKAFPDGVLWITLGKEPKNLVLWQKYLIKQIGNEEIDFKNILLGRAILQKLLVEKTCLLILDDLWNVEHATAFLALGTQCKLLVTTRSINIVNELGARECHLDVLSHKDALNLLAKYAVQSVTKLPTEAKNIVEECGYLPLAIAMIGAMLRGKHNRWDNVLHKLKNMELEKIKQNFPDYPYHDLMTAIEVSVEALGSEIQAFYLDFACFPENLPIPESALKTFWEPKGLDKYETQDILDELANKSLAQRYDQESLILHPLQFDYIHQRTGLPKFDELLLQACNDKGLDIETSEYISRNLVYHLSEAGQGEKIGWLALQLYCLNETRG